MALSEDTLRALTRRIIDELGPRATPDNVRAKVKAAVERMEQDRSDSGDALPHFATSHLGRAGTQIIVTVYGKNRPGVLAAVTQCLAGFNANIVDVSQKLMLDWFTMILVVEAQGLSSSFAELQKALKAVGEAHNMKIHAQHEDVFSAMHRV
jgi:ACT domain-containing protein